MKKLVEIYCFCCLAPKHMQPSKRKNGIDPPLALIVVLLRVSVDHLGVDQHPRQARAQGDQRIKRADCSQARFPRLCWSDLKPLSSPRARAVTGRRNSHRWEGGRLFEPSAGFFYGNSCNSGTESRKIVSKVGN